MGEVAEMQQVEDISSVSYDSVVLTSALPGSFDLDKAHWPNINCPVFVNFNICLATKHFFFFAGTFWRI